MTGAVRGSYVPRKRIRSLWTQPVVRPVLKWPPAAVFLCPKFSKINKNTKMFTKWVAVARKSLLTIAFCIIFRGAPHGDVRFGQNPILLLHLFFLLLLKCFLYVFCLFGVTRWYFCFCFCLSIRFNPLCSSTAAWGKS